MNSFLRRLIPAFLAVLLTAQLALPSVAETDEEPRREVISDQYLNHDVSVVTFELDGAVYRRVFVRNGAFLGSLPAAPSVSGRIFLGWYDGDAPVSEGYVVTSSLTLKAVYASADAQAKAKAKYTYFDIGAYAIMDAYGSYNGNSRPTVNSISAVSGLENGSVLQAYSVSGVKGNTAVTLNLYIRALPELNDNETLAVYSLNNGALGDKLADVSAIAQKISLSVDHKSANGIALIKLTEPEEVPTETISRKAQGTLYSNDEIYLTGKLPGNGIIEVTPVTISVDGREAVAAYDIKIYANENQQRKGKTWQPAGSKVKVHFYSERFLDAAYDVYHITDASADLVCEAQAKDGVIEFEADGFSVYAITETTLNQTVRTSEVQVTYKNTSGIPMRGTALKVTELKDNDLAYGAYLEGSLEALSISPERLDLARLFDISIVSEQDESIVYEPSGDVDVSIRLIGAELDAYEKLDVLHFMDGEPGAPAQGMSARVEGDTVSFTTGSFSVYVVAGYTIEKVIETGDGSTYKMSITFLSDAELPDDADIAVSELSGEAYGDYVGRASVALEAGGFAYARVFDISIVDGEGNKQTPSAPVQVTVTLLDAENETDDFSVIHFAGEERAARGRRKQWKYRNILRRQLLRLRDSAGSRRSTQRLRKA